MRRVKQRFAAIPAAVPEQCRGVRAMRLFVEVAYNVGRGARLGSFPSRAGATSAWCLVMLICDISASLLLVRGCWWRGLDSNQRRCAPTDLQSVPFSLSGTPPRSEQALYGQITTIVNEAMVPMTDLLRHATSTYRTVEMHAAGEPVRLVLEGFPEPRGATVLEKRNDAATRLDVHRRRLMLEPRGHAEMYGALP